MKLPVGVTVYIGGKKYRGEVPDHLAPVDEKKTEKKTEKREDAK